MFALPEWNLKFGPQLATTSHLISDPLIKYEIWNALTAKSQVLSVVANIHVRR